MGKNNSANIDDNDSENRSRNLKDFLYEEEDIKVIQQVLK